MKLFFKILRAVVVTLFALCIGVPTAVYLLLSSDWAQDRLRSIAEKELTSLLGAKVEIGYVKFQPFSRIKIQDVCIDDDNGVKALRIGEIDGRAEIFDLVLRQRIIIDYAIVKQLDLQLYRQDEQSPLNIAGIIDRLKTEEKKEPSVFDLRFNNVALIDCSFSYDVLSAPETPGRFNPRHIGLTKIYTETFAPKISNDCYRLRLRSLSCLEQSGLNVRRLTADALLSPEELSLTSVSISLPNSLLRFNDINAQLNGIESLGEIFRHIPADVSLEEGSHVFLADLSPFVPDFSESDIDIDIDFDAGGTLDSLSVRRLAVIDKKGLFKFNLEGSCLNLDSMPNLSTPGTAFSLSCRPNELMSQFPNSRQYIPISLQPILSCSGTTVMEGKFCGNIDRGHLSASLSADWAATSVVADYTRIGDSNTWRLILDASIDSARTSVIMPGRSLELISGRIVGNGIVGRNGFRGNLETVIDRCMYKGYIYQDIKAVANLDARNINVVLESDDQNAKIDAALAYSRDGKTTSFSGNCDIKALCPHALNLISKYPGYVLSGKINLSGSGTDVDNLCCNLDVFDVAFKNDDKEGLFLNKFSLDADNRGSRDHLSITSDILNGSVDGEINPSTLAAAAQRIVASVVPAIAPDGAEAGNSAEDRCNNFTFDFTLDGIEKLSGFLGIPYAAIDAVSITGDFNEKLERIFVNVDMPWTLQGKNLVEDTSIAVRLGGPDNDMLAYLTTYYPTIKGPMTLVSTITGSNGIFDTDIDWQLERSDPIFGKFSFTTSLFREVDNSLGAVVHFNPGMINFGEDVWRIHDSTLKLANGQISVNDFRLTSDDQRLVVDGVVGDSESDLLTVEMVNIHLINIFETLGINNALLGGYAYGTIDAAGVLGKNRKISGDNIHIKDVGYNYCTLGNADAKVWFDNDSQAFCFDVEVTSFENKVSEIHGSITPASKKLDLRFEADHINIGFLKPFMSAFSSGVEGHGSGKAHLYGTFEDLNMEGDLYADDMRLKIDFTNVWYSASDSIHIRPNRINLDNLRIYDPEGHSALVNGYIGHECFRNATFDINITDASNFIAYDVPKSLSPDWYGKIYGDGSASVKGQPGVVDIIANMSTAPNSTFTYELSDFEMVDEYSFITFRDVTPHEEITDTILVSDLTPERVKQIREERLKTNMQSATNYRMDLNIDIKQNAKVILVMDPVGGDAIDSRGDGHLRMTYDAAENDLKLYGRYTLNSGDYTFTLQDIIIKKFSIKEGSSIYFNGNYLAGKLDIEAYTTVNANLSDLDESFLTDKDLNRTNVPVRALMKVTGDMRQPDLSFDLEFPTLNNDIYRKVRSIISTEEMMNKQIIYLLALNRFFTPDYMSATRGNEIFAVASSTITSQISSMLGKLSDNWSIAPNLRSDKGDFSDIEVDVNLSSSLLNNRLLLNGNFGYRDKSLNTNQFVGDFDVEYLLSRQGTWRLKAYNRYNDQNYYLRTAQTTQGIGLVFRRDFDSFLTWIRKRPKKEQSVANDSIE